MAITVKDIHEKEFTRQVRGYQIDEVDDFLDEIAEQMEKLIRENRALAQKLAEKQGDAPAVEAPAAIPAPVAAPEPAAAPVAPAASADDSAYFRNLETTLRDTLVSAQRVAEDTVSEAQKKAEKLVAVAEDQAEGILSGAKAEAVKVRAESDELRKASEEYRAAFLRLVEGQVRVLKADETLYK